MELISGNTNKKNLIFGKYKLTKIIGSGSFGYVYEGINVIDYKAVAVKVEKKDNGLNLLEKESFYLYNLKGIGLPEVISFGYSGKYNVLVQTLLGESLGKIFFKNNNRFSIKDICMFSIQILHRIEFVHSKNIIHRDIKPENFLIGEPDKYLIYIIDFGLSKKYKSSRTNKHIQFRLTKKFTGTARYASLNAVRGAEQSRRDDLEAIGYMLLFFFNGGKLPWQGISCKQKAEKYVKIYTMKKNLNFEEFCKNMPKEIIDYMKYCRELEFEKKPDYAYLRGLFEKALKHLGEYNDLHFSWIKDLSILKNYHNLKSRIAPANLGKRKESPQSRIIKKLENNRETIKEKEVETDTKSLKTNASLQNMQNIVLLKRQTQTPQYIIHKRFNSSGDYTLKRSKDSENKKSGIAQHNTSIEDEEQIAEKTFSNKKEDIKMIKEIINKNKDNSKINQKSSKNNLFYFSGNVIDLSQSLVMKNINKNKLNESGMEQNNENKNQNSSFFMHNRLFSSNSINKNENLISPNIIKSLSFIKKIKPKIVEIKENINSKTLKENNNNQKYVKNKSNISNMHIKNNGNNNNNMRKNICNFKNKFSILKINCKDIIKKQNTNININNNKNKKNIYFGISNTNNNSSKNKQNNIINQQKTKKLGNTMKKDKKRKIIKMKVKNIPNINIQVSLNNLNCKSSANIFKKNTSPNNLQHNIKYSFIQKANNKHLKKENIIKTENLTNNNINNNFEGKINKIKSMNIHSNTKKKENPINYKKITTQEIFKNNINNRYIINKNNSNSNFDIFNINQNRINKYKNMRHKIQRKIGNLPIQNSMTRVTELSMQKPRTTNGTVNSTINNCNTVNNTINTNNNNNTIISIFNNYNIDNKDNNRYGFIHKKLGNFNIAWDTLNNINKEKYKNNNYSSYNGYKVKLNNYKSYIHLNPRKNTTLINKPSLNQISNYTTLNSRLNNESNHYNSQILSNKDLSCQEIYLNKKIENYFSLNNQIKDINEYKQNKNMNLSSSRPNLNSFRIKKIFNEFNKDEPKVKRIERNKTENLMNIGLFKNEEKDNTNTSKFEPRFNIMRSNSFLYDSSNFMHFDFKNKLDYNTPSINRKNTQIFYQGMPTFKMNYNIYDSNLINMNNKDKPALKSHRAQSRDYYSYNSLGEKNKYGFFS